MLSRIKKIPWDGAALVGLACWSVGTLIVAAVETNIGDADRADSFPDTGSRHVLTKTAVDSLNTHGMYVMENVLTRKELIAAHAGATAIYKEGRMDLTANDATVRQDRVCWVRELDGIDGSAAEANVLQPGLLHCVKLLRGLSTELEELGYDRSFNHFVPKQCQLSRYAGDGSQGYLAHRDAASSDNFWEVGVLAWLRGQDYRKRRVTAILYLNLPGWDDAVDGGKLKCYLNCSSDDHTGETASSVRAINPAGGTLVLFDSTYLLHEVTPSSRDRYALTIWITGEDIPTDTATATTPSNSKLTATTSTTTST